MSQLTITVTHYHGENVDEPPHAQFGTEGGTIGRSTASTLLLPDPERQISRTHALIEHDGEGFVLRDQGSATPVIVNGRTVGHGHSARIGPGDQIVIGRYAMKVERDAFDPDATMLHGKLPDVQAANPAADISMIGTVLSWTEGGAPASDGIIQTLIVPSPVHGDIAEAPSDDRSQQASVASAEEAARADAPQDSGPTIMYVRAPGAPAVDAAAATESVAPASAPAGEVATPDALLQAFLTGAGVPKLTVPGGLTPELMHAVGSMLRETVRGLLDLLHARALTKRELHAQATVIVAQDNNPLKFSPTIEAAMAHLLVPRGMGFMPPVRAVADAHQGLRSHQLAFMAGMHAALESVLKRLDPKALERRSGEPSLIGSFVPAAHKAHLWDEYGQLHRTIAQDAAVDFQSLFGREFLKAYQREITELSAPDVRKEH